MPRGLTKQKLIQQWMPTQAGFPGVSSPIRKTSRTNVRRTCRASSENSLKFRRDIDVLAQEAARFPRHHGRSARDPGPRVAAGRRQPSLLVSIEPPWPSALSTYWRPRDVDFAVRPRSRPSATRFLQANRRFDLTVRSLRRSPVPPTRREISRYPAPPDGGSGTSLAWRQVAQRGP